MLSVVRSPVHMYIGTNVLLIRNGSGCWCFDRLATVPLNDALNRLTHAVQCLQLGWLRRVEIFVSAALCPPTHHTPPGGNMAALQRRCIADWLIHLGLLPIQIRPLWAVCTELPAVASNSVKMVVFEEPDAITLLSEADDGTLTATWLDDESTPAIRQYPPTDISMAHVIKIRFNLLAVESGQKANHWPFHWERL